MSWHSIDFNCLPTAPLNMFTVNVNKSTKGSGQLDLTTNVFNLAPAGLSLDKSQLGI